MAPSVARGHGGKKIDGGKGGKSPKVGSGGAKKKGNPQRKSQYSTHPVYKAYRTAKMAVEKKAKTDKVPFKDVAGEARKVYDDALSAWLQAKSGFRASRKEDEATGSEPTSDQAAERCGGDIVAHAGQKSPDASSKTPVRATKRARTGSGGDPASHGKYSIAPPSWTADDGDWFSLNREQRRSAWKQADVTMEE